jgi:chloramphenicol-sensitive protein RarD
MLTSRTPFDPTLPLNQAHTLPASCYTDLHIHNMERFAILAKSWQSVRTAALRDISWWQPDCWASELSQRTLLTFPCQELPLPSQSQFRSGLSLGIIAYLCWGAVPLYFAQVKTVEAWEILAHRIGWSLPLMLIVTVCTTGGVSKLRQVLRSRKLLLTLLASALFLSMNWLLYIYATVTQRVAEASLGYYMMPVVNAFLATMFLGERLRPAHYPALALILIGVSIPVIVKQEFAWLAVLLPITFGLYGLIRKKIPVDSGTGLTVETLLLFAPCAGYVCYLWWHGVSSFGTTPALSGWLAFGGVVTVVPLLTYTLSIRRIPLVTQAMIQFISPTVQLLLAVIVLGEWDKTAWDRWAAMVSVWVASGVFIVDAVVQNRQLQKPAIPPSVDPTLEPLAEPSRV